jgi:hypothetical protein
MASPNWEGTRQIVLLHNDRDAPVVREIYKELAGQLRDRAVRPWMASEDMSAFGDMFDNIEGAIARAMGVVVFLGQHGLGRFQRNIELGAVATEQWQQGAKYGALLVHLSPGVEVPRTLLRWPTVNHDGSLSGAKALANGILERFRLQSGS